MNLKETRRRLLDIISPLNISLDSGMNFSSSASRRKRNDARNIATTNLEKIKLLPTIKRGSMNERIYVHIMMLHLNF